MAPREGPGNAHDEYSRTIDWRGEPRVTFSPSRWSFRRPSVTIGPEGEVTIRLGDYYLVIYDATPESLEYELQSVDCGGLFESCRPVPCAEAPSPRARQ